MKKLPIGIQSFREIIQGDYLYVDKTAQIYNLISQGKLYFLSRPRRFGKSLLTSTLKELFSGHQELFEGLYISEKTAYSWQKWPVLDFDFGKGRKVQDLKSYLKKQLLYHADKFGIFLKEGELFEQVEQLVKDVSKQHQAVVFLVDEYDKPIVDFLTDIHKAQQNRELLRDFFSPLKDLEKNGHLRFLFITGVSKFSKVSIFSDLNNLIDLTIRQINSDLVGITEQELLANFEPYIQQSIQKLGFPRKDFLAALKTWYNGYSWDGKTFVYNPFSLLNFFADSRFGNFWFATGTPTFLVEHIRKSGVQPMELEKKEFLETFFDRFTIDQLDTYNLLFQTGYLTIKSTRYDEFELRYRLGYPNREVQQAFIYNLLEAYT